MDNVDATTSGGSKLEIKDVIGELGIDQGMYCKVVNGEHTASVIGFARIYISALQLHVTQLTSEITQLKWRINLL